MVKRNLLLGMADMLLAVSYSCVLGFHLVLPSVRMMVVMRRLADSLYKWLARILPQKSWVKHAELNIKNIPREFVRNPGQQIDLNLPF
jgi:hypothetical protein